MKLILSKRRCIFETGVRNALRSAESTRCRCRSRCRNYKTAIVVLVAEKARTRSQIIAPAKCPVTQLAGGVQSGMGYLGAQDLPTLRAKARYIRVSPAGQRESAPHDIVEVKTGS